MCVCVFHVYPFLIRVPVHSTLCLVAVELVRIPLVFLPLKLNHFSLSPGPAPIYMLALQVLALLIMETFTYYLFCCKALEQRL